jgi:hypothetical protein
VAVLRFCAQSAAVTAGRWEEAVMDKDLAGQVADIAHRVVASGAISANGHGNVSVRVPGAAEMYFTAGPSRYRKTCGPRHCSAP